LKTRREEGPEREGTRETHQHLRSRISDYRDRTCVMEESSATLLGALRGGGGGGGFRQGTQTTEKNTAYDHNAGTSGKAKARGG